MKTSLALLFCLATLPGPALAVAAPVQWSGSVEAAMAEAERTEALVMVDLYADWCGWCKRLEEDVFSTPEFARFAEDFVLLRVDTEDGDQGTELQRKYEAFNLPTTLVLDRHGVMVASIGGYSPAPQYIASVKAGVEAFEELVRGFERFGDSSDPKVLAILADEFHQRYDGRRAAQLYRRILSLAATTAESEIRFRYQLADALRLAEQYDESAREIAVAKASLQGDSNAYMSERLDLLTAQISIDRGDCNRAKAELEEFLGNYPGSDLSRFARQKLASLRTQGTRCS